MFRIKNTEYKPPIYKNYNKNHIYLDILPYPEVVAIHIFSKS